MEPSEERLSEEGEEAAKRGEEHRSRSAEAGLAIAGLMEQERLGLWILSEMASHWQDLNRGLTRSGLHVGRITLTSVWRMDHRGPRKKPS